MKAKINTAKTKFLLCKLLILLVFSYICINNVMASSYTCLTYNLSAKDIKKSILNVEFVLQGHFGDYVTLNLPFKWAGANYIEQIKNIKISPEYKINFIKQEKDWQAVIAIPANHKGEIKISYEIHQSAGDPSNVHEAIIRNNLVHAPGYGIFAIPDDLHDELSENSKINVIINWKDIDPQWKILSSCGSSFDIGKSLKLELTMFELLHAIYVAGDIRLYQISDNKSPVYLSLYGEFDLEDKKIISDITNIVESQRKFFNDFDFPYYAISIIQGNKLGSMGGTRLHNSFTAFLPKGETKADYYILFAHEHLHNWIGGKIRKNEDESLNYWWTEGFTDFYSRLIAYRSKSIDKNTFINEINKFLRSYYLSPVNQEPNSRIKKDFWNNYDIQKLPYYRGFVFAIYLNDLIKKNNPDKSLDDVIHELFRVSSEKRFSTDLFKEIVNKYVKDGIDREISSFIEQGGIIPLENIRHLS